MRISPLALTPLLLLATGLSAAAQTAAPLAPNAASGLHCTEDAAFCFGIGDQGAYLASPEGARLGWIWDGPDLPRAGDLTLMPELIRLDAQRALLGVVEAGFQPYSGGGFESRDLHLFLVDLDRPADASTVALLPLTRDISIRACFDEASTARRNDYCSDAYSFEATLGFEPGSDLWPEIVVETSASRFPAGARRDTDNSALTITGTPVAESDASCSYQMRYRFSAAEAAYRPASPLPDCAEFLAP